MKQVLTTTQRQRLVELNAPNYILESEFEDIKERDIFFKEHQVSLTKMHRNEIMTLLNEQHKPLSLRIQEQFVNWLTNKEGFTQVATPLIISESMLSKMTITKEHPLTNQVFWLDQKKCLRPMLAPNLYELMRDLQKVTKDTVRIFEVGPCFRKETQGAQHMNEFTMLNLVELAGVKEGNQMERLTQLAKDAMEVIGIVDYELVVEKSEVYGETLDIVVDDLELASGAYGPHFLDAKWGIFDTWVGIGFGMERVAMAKGNYQTIKRAGRSLSYINGSPLNL